MRGTLLYIAYRTDVAPRREIARGETYREALAEALRWLDPEGYISVEEAMEELSGDKAARLGIAIEAVR